jgi:hypothetical protein
MAHTADRQALAPTAKSDGGFYGSMDACRRYCDADLRFVFGGAC